MMYTKYYVATIDKNAKEWAIREENSNDIVDTFDSKELAIQYVNKLCRNALDCIIIVNDKSTYSISLDN